MSRSAKAGPMKRSTVFSLTAGSALALIGLAPNSAYASCPDNQYESCDPLGFTCICLPKIGGSVGQGAEAAKKQLQSVIDHPASAIVPLVAGAPLAGYQFVQTTDPGGHLVEEINRAGQDGFRTIQKAGDGAVMTVSKAGSDYVQTIEKGWSDARDQTVRSFNDTVDAGAAIARFEERQLRDRGVAFENASSRAQEGKLVDALWGAATEPLSSSSKNFAKAAQESEIINMAAQSAAAAYGGPGGAAAYAAWYTYEQTGNAQLAMRAGALAALQSGAGANVASMPTGTVGEVLKKAAVSGAMGGIAIAAQGGSQEDVTNAFLKSGGAVLVQAGNQRLSAASPKLSAALDTAKCLSSVTVACASDISYVRDEKNKLVTYVNGKRQLLEKNFDFGPDAARFAGDASQAAAYVSRHSKIPRTEAVAVLDSKWILTSTFKSGQSLKAGAPSVVLTYVGDNAPVYQVTRMIPIKSRQTAHPSQGATSRASMGTEYTCHAAGVTRRITTTTLAHACTSLYLKPGAQQVIWRSLRDPKICQVKAYQFAQHLRKLGVSCKRN